MTKKQMALIAKWLFIVAALLVIYLPLVLIIVYSFIDTKFIGVAGDFTFAHYLNLFENERLIEAGVNTMIIGVLSSLISVALGTLTAVGIFYLKRGKKAVNALSQVTVINAEIVTAVGFFLMFIFVRDTFELQIQRDILWLTLTHSMLTTPYVILAVSPRLNQLDPNLFEAGMDLGARPMRVLMTIIFPQLITGMISGFAIAFTLSLDDFVITKLNTIGSGIETISTYVYDGLKRELDPSVRALSTIIFVVILLVLVGGNIYSKRKAKNAKMKYNQKKMYK